MEPGDIIALPMHDKDAPPECPPMSPTKLCFIASPIGAPGTPERRHADWLLNGIIIPVFDEYPEYRVERSDKIPIPGMIDSQVINRLHDAELVIIDMSFQNANVFYEMGIRHKTPLPTIHMYRQDEEIPFDVRLYRAIPFNYVEHDDLIKARSQLKIAVDEVINGIEIDNPVTRARGIQKIEERATEPEKLMAQEISALRQGYSVLERLMKELLFREEQRMTAAALRHPQLDVKVGDQLFARTPRTTEAPKFTTIFPSASLSNSEEPK
jgi:hypothetical protein